MNIPERLAGQKIVCPWWLCFTFDNPLRKLLHNPETILNPYVHRGNTVIDIGPGMGYFTIPLAELVGKTGRVVAVDIQTKMLSALSSRAQKRGVLDIIQTHLSSSESIGIHLKADFVLAFWMLHEVPNQHAFLAEIRNVLKPDGLFLLAEPIVHVTKKGFLRALRIATELGFVLKATPHIRISHSALLGSAHNGL